MSQQEVLRKDWMFKLVGTETFMVGLSKTRATISIEAASGLAYHYSLLVDGKSLQDFMNNRAKTTKTWAVHVDGTDHRIVLGESTGQDGHHSRVQSDLDRVHCSGSGLIPSLCPNRKGHHGHLVQRTKDGLNGETLCVSIKRTVLV